MRQIFYRKNAFKHLISPYYKSDLSHRSPLLLNLPEPDSRLLVPELGNDISYTVYLGKTAYKRLPFYYNPFNMVNPHIAILGTSGAGKSETIKSFILEFKRKNPIKPPIIILDPQGEYVYIASILERQGIPTKVFRIGIDTTINIFERPSIDTPYDEWIDNVILPSIYKMGGIDEKRASVMASKLKQIIYDVYEKIKGFKRDDPTTWRDDPTLELVYQKLQEEIRVAEISRSEDKVKSSALRSLIPLSDRLYRWVYGALDFFASKSDVSMRSIMNYSLVVIDYSAIQTNEVAEEVLLNYIFTYFFTLMARSPPVGGLDLILVFDEAWTLLKKQTGTRISPIEKLTRIARKYGFMCIFATQKTEDIDTNVLPLIGCVFVLKLPDKKQVERISRIGIPDRLKNELLYLDVGEAVVVPRFKTLKGFENPKTPVKVRIIRRTSPPVKLYLYPIITAKELFRMMRYNVRKYTQSERR